MKDSKLMVYENLKIFDITDNNGKIVYYGYTKCKLCRKLAEMKHIYKLNINCNKFKAVFDKYGIDTLIIGLVDVISVNDIGEVDKNELTQNNIID